jgi:hypothetical protein
LGDIFTMQINSQADVRTSSAGNEVCRWIGMQEPGPVNGIYQAAYLRLVKLGLQVAAYAILACAFDQKAIFIQQEQGGVTERHQNILINTGDFYHDRLCFPSEG